MSACKEAPTGSQRSAANSMRLEKGAQMHEPLLSALPLYAIVLKADVPIARRMWLACSCIRRFRRRGMGAGTAAYLNSETWRQKSIARVVV